MSSLISEGEKFVSSQEGGSGSGGQQSGQGQGSGGQQGGQQQGGSGGGSSEDKYINEAVDKVASAEGIPGAADGEINKEVDQEVNNL